jgi:dolichol-phosphate mannosyltransferase
MLANTEDAYGFPPFSIMERAITLRSRNLRSGKKQDISVLRSLERDILEDFLRNVSVSRMISPNFGWADVIPQRVLDSSGHATNGHARVLADIVAGAPMNGNGEYGRPAARSQEETVR